MKRQTRIFSCLICFSTLIGTEGFLHGYRGLTNGRPVGTSLHTATNNCFNRQTVLQFAVESNPSSAVSSSITKYESTQALNDELSRMCNDGASEDAMKLLEKLSEDDQCSIINEASYILVIAGFTSNRHPKAPEMADRLLEGMKMKSRLDPICSPTKHAYNSVISAWAKSRRKTAGARCDALLEELWSLHTDSDDSRHVPLKTSYMSTITALSRSRGGRQAAERAEEILEDMEMIRVEYPHLAPTTICVNAVLNAWSKSGVRDASNRCEAILQRMEDFFRQGRLELQPNTTSFNTVLDSLAKSRQKGSERRAEALLKRLEGLGKEFDELKDTCKPDQLSFNTVLNCWAHSRENGAARRANAILRHMEHRFESNSTEIYPDAAAYTTVINAWARTGRKDKRSTAEAEDLLEQCESAYRNGRSKAKPQTLMYNSLINCYAKSNQAKASDRAIKVLNQMKELSQEDGRTDCQPDVVTYTSVIDTLARRGSSKAAETAEALLKELEDSFSRTGDKRLKPNLLTYTATIKAIARSGVDPERAEDIINRIESQYENGNMEVQPDVVSFNALLNAYGWSDRKGKSAKCYEIYKSILDLYESGRNPDAKPDIITCNTVLNACIFENTETELEKAQVMDIVIQVLEAFQTAAPTFGWPNYITYSHVLLSISKHMPLNNLRLDLAEATFWQCCQSGQVSVMVVSNLAKAVSWEKLAAILGPALLSKEDETLKFDYSMLPAQWSQYAPKRPPSSNNHKRKQQSRPSKKRDVSNISPSKSRNTFR